MSLGLYEFRIDENLYKSRIIVTTHEECSKKHIVFETIEFMIDKLNRTAMKPKLRYVEHVKIWKENKDSKHNIC